MTRFARPTTEAGMIEPRSAAGPAQPGGHAAFARLAGAAGMIALTTVLFWLLSDASFRVTAADVTFEGLEHADEAAVRGHLEGLDRSPNVFRVRASEIVSGLQALPEVDSASATVTIPASIVVEVRERQPIFVWSDRTSAWLVDRTGMLFAATEVPFEEAAPVPGTDAAASPETPSAAEIPSAAETPSSREASEPTTRPSSPAEAAGSPDPSVGTAASAIPSPAPAAAGSLLPVDAGSSLPLVEDQRLPEAPPAAGSFLPAVDLAVMRQLLALTPAVLGSRSQSLSLRVDEYDGYVLSSDRGWQAVFGHYTPTLQPPDVVPRQVQCLRWLLAAEERRLERVRLAVSEDACGTYTLFGRPAEEPRPADPRPADPKPADPRP